MSKLEGGHSPEMHLRKGNKNSSSVESKKTLLNKLISVGTAAVQHP